MTPDEQKAADDKVAADKAAADKAAEDKAAADKVAADKEAADKAAAAQQSGMTEEQLKAWEQQTGLDRKQMIGVQLIQQATMANSPVTEILEQRVITRVEGDLKAKGITDFKVYEADIKERLKKCTPQERLNPLLVSNL